VQENERPGEEVRPFLVFLGAEVATERDLTGQVVLVTGASRGLGRALAEAFAGAGARLVLCARGEADLRGVAEQLAARGAEVEWAVADVADAAAVNDLVARAAERFGPVTVLVNNASVLGPRVPLREYPLDEWRRVLEANLTGTLIPILAVLPGMRQAGGGSIINVSSGVGHVARARWGAYGVSKWGVEALTRNLALEEATAGVRANIVDPGRLRTEMRRAAYPDEDPLKPAPPESAVAVFLWLASSASRGVTGERFEAQDWA
jgi:NAD(P)-dependent dehydrogenase (short-subunit alcohol dehydrogenase family)